MNKLVSYANLKYELIEELHSARFEVYKAKCETNTTNKTDLMSKTDLIVVLKILSSDFNCKSDTAELLREIEEVDQNQSPTKTKFTKLSRDYKLNNAGLEFEYATLDLMNHPGIVNVLDRGDSFIVFEYLKGSKFKFDIKEEFKIKIPSFKKNRFAYFTGKIKNYFNHSDMLNNENVRTYLKNFSNLLSSVKYVHEQDILHKDLKPDNVVLTNSGPILIDFDFAININEQNSDLFPNLVCGTPEYLSPETASGKTLKFNSDIYSLGIMLYESFTADSKLFAINNYIELFKFKAQSHFFSPRMAGINIPRELDNIIKRATMVNVNFRTSNIDELKGELDRLLE